MSQLHPECEEAPGHRRQVLPPRSLCEATRTPAPASQFVSGRPSAEKQGLLMPAPWVFHYDILGV